MLNDHLSLLAARDFRRSWIALALYHLGSWGVMAALPILVAQRFGIGAELVLSIGVKLLPRILLAPYAGAVLQRLGGRRVAATSIALLGLTTVLPPWCASFLVLQAVILLSGTLEVMVMPALHLLRSELTPPGRELAGNTLFQSAGQVAKLLGPALGGVAVAGFGVTAAFAGFGLAMLLAALIIPSGPRARGSTGAATRPLAVIAEFRDTLRRDPVVANTLLLAVLYLVMLGGMRPFLFWANVDWYGAPSEAWTALLAAQGAGSLLGLRCAAGSAGDCSGRSAPTSCRSCSA